MKDVKTLWKGDWVSVVSPKDSQYESLHEPDVVLILPILGNKVGIREEFCPPYLIKDETGESLYYTVISGKIEEGETKENAALRELKEESGVTVEEGFSIIPIFEDLPLSKSTDMRGTMFVIKGDVESKETPKGDGTEDEKKSKTIWVTKDEFFEILEKKKNIDFLLFSSFFFLIPFFTNKETSLQKITYLQDSFFNINNSDVAVEELQIKNLLKSQANITDDEVDDWVKEIKEKGSKEFPIKEANKGVIVNMYEVDYPMPRDPNKETQEMASHLDDNKDFVNQYLFPGSETQDIIVGLRSDVLEEGEGKKKNWRDTLSNDRRS
jgi:8-oxo-dGTP pyrophosphatase MutT (NUDIX family)